MTKPWTVLLLIAVLCGSGWMFYLIDDGLGLAWPQNVVRNWQQFGLLTLHGKMVTNPGGFQAIANPQVYSGMSPVCLYPAYLATTLFGWTGLGTLAFHLLLALAVFWGAWFLLGKDHFACLVAVAVILSPGYIRWQKILDPNTLAILPAIPFAAIMLVILNQHKPRPGSLAIMLILTLAFMSFNWTTALVAAPCVLLLSRMPSVNWSGLIQFVAALAFGAIAVAGVSVLAKSGVGHHGANPPRFSQFLAAYTWGNVGYGQGLTTAKAFLRLTFTNGVGLLPVWLIVAFAAAYGFRTRPRTFWPVTAPLAATVMEIVFLRNYFGHHPWMAAPLLLVGAIFSLAVLRASFPEGLFNRIPRQLAPASALCCFLYGLAVLAFFRANEAGSLSMVRLVRQHSVRSDEIAIVKALDPQTAATGSRLAELLDRRVVVANSFIDLPVEPGRYFILSAVKLKPPFVLIAQSSTSESGWMSRIADWFNHSIARRNPGDRMDFAGTNYLYQSNAGPFGRN